MKQVLKTKGLELPCDYKTLVVAEEAGFNAIGCSQEALVAAWDVARRGDALVCGRG